MAHMTAAAQAVGFSFVDATELAQHVVNLLETQGETALSIVTGILKLIKAVGVKDMASVFAVLAQERVDVTALIAAVKVEFGLS